MLPGDRLVCAFVEPQAVGKQFSDWLLHVTVVPWFRLDEPSEQIAVGLERALCPIGPFEARAGETVQFGPKKNRPARLLTPTVPLEELEKRARNYLHKKRAWLVDETTKKPRQFRPHVTVQKSDELTEGQKFKVHKLYIVEQKGDYRQPDKSGMPEIPTSENNLAYLERLPRSKVNPRLESHGLSAHYKEITAVINL